MVTDVVWREGQPQTARRVRNWAHGFLLEFWLGLPAHRVCRFRAPAELGFDQLSAVDVARAGEHFFMERSR